MWKLAIESRDRPLAMNANDVRQTLRPLLGGPTDCGFGPSVGSLSTEKIAERNRANGPAVYLAQPEWLGLWFSHHEDGQRPNSLVCEAMSQIPCDLQLAGLLAQASFLTESASHSGNVPEEFASGTFLHRCGL